MQTTYPGSIFVLSAPSGAGKTSLVKALLPTIDNLTLSISHTTRMQRPGETDGKDYYFVSQAIFQRMLSEGVFIEHACVYGNYYGTSRAHIEQDLQQGKNILLEIDWQGAEQVKQHFADAIRIFILPPSREALYQRLTNRGQDDAQIIAQRMQQAKQEMQHYTQSDYLLINDDFDLALSQLQSIIQAGLLRRAQQQLKQADLLRELTI